MNIRVVSVTFLIFLCHALKYIPIGHSRLGSANWTIEQFGKFLNRPSTSSKAGASTTFKSTLTSRPQQPTSPYSQTSLDPYQKLYKWAQANQVLNGSLDQDHELTQGQQRKVMEYMVNDTYFQEQLVGQLKQNEANRWVSLLPPRAQVRYLKIISGLTSQDMQSRQNLGRVEEKLLEDYDIQGVYRKFMVDHPAATPLQAGWTILYSNYL